jgi:nicotinamidase/pyrazinamidase
VIDYDEATALVVVDVQNDFAHPDGSLAVAGGEGVLAAVNAELARARAAGALVVYTQDWHPPETPHFASQGGPWPPHCVQGTWGAELHPGLDAAPDEPRIRKGSGSQDGYSGFRAADQLTGQVTSTGLEELLRDARIERVVVVGLATDYCVRDTALDAVDLGFPTTVVTGAVRAVNVQRGDGDAALARMRAAGVTLA